MKCLDDDFFDIICPAFIRWTGKERNPQHIFSVSRILLTIFELLYLTPSNFFQWTYVQNARLRCLCGIVIHSFIHSFAFQRIKCWMEKCINNLMFWILAENVPRIKCHLGICSEHDTHYFLFNSFYIRHSRIATKWREKIADWHECSLEKIFPVQRMKR